MSFTLSKNPETLQLFAERGHQKSGDISRGFGDGLVLPSITPFLKDRQPLLVHRLPAGGNVPLLNIATNAATQRAFSACATNRVSTRQTGYLVNSEFPLFLYRLHLNEQEVILALDAGLPANIRAIQEWQILGFIPTLLSNTQAIGTLRLPFRPDAELQRFFREAAALPAQISDARHVLLLASMADFAVQEVVSESARVVFVNDIESMMSLAFGPRPMSFRESFIGCKRLKTD